MNNFLLILLKGRSLINYKLKTNMNKKSTSLFITAAVALGGVAMTGCQQTSQYSTTRGVQSTVTVPSTEKKVTVVNNTGTTVKLAGGTALPPNAKPGDCFTRVVVPPTYRTVSERVEVEPAGQRIEMIPAKYKTVEERIVTKPASYRLEVVPATYKKVSKRVMISPAITNLVEVPAKYEWTEKKILVEPERTEWKPGKGLVEKVDNATGEILCLVTIPAKYKVVREKVLVSAAATRQEVTPARYETIETTEVATPETTRKVAIDAEYGTVKRRVLVEASKRNVIKTEPKYEMVQKQIRVDGGSQDWRQILCETNVTPEVVARIQQALKGAGHNPGAVNGQLNQQTVAAIREFQIKNNLATGGVTFETLKRLSVAL